MNIPEKQLNVIGLEMMTNRDVIMKELAGLDNAAFEHVLFSRQSDAPEMVEFAKCDDCKTQHGGECTASDDEDPCALNMSDWLSQPCTHDRLLSEVPV